MHTKKSDRIFPNKNYLSKWWSTQFGSQYLQTLNFNFLKYTSRQVRFIERVASLTPGITILDVGCGHGRHAISLALKGYNVVGIDYSKTFIQIAKKIAKEKHARVLFKKEDMRYLRYHNMFDVVLSLYTSFGYFDHAENLRVLKNMKNALKNNGMIILDVLNADMLFREFKEHGQPLSNHLLTRTFTHRKDKYIFMDTEQLDTKTQRTHLYRKWKLKNMSGDYNFHILRYTLLQLIQMLAKEGFLINSIWGDYNTSPWTTRSKRTIFVATKTSKHPIIIMSLAFGISIKYILKQFIEDVRT